MHGYVGKLSDHQKRRTNLGLTKGKAEWGEINQERGVSVHTLLHIKETNNKELPQGTGSRTQRL